MAGVQTVIDAMIIKSINFFMDETQAQRVADDIFDNVKPDSTVRLITSTLVLDGTVLLHQMQYSVQ
jgi:hypothetical protein